MCRRRAQRRAGPPGDVLARATRSRRRSARRAASCSAPASTCRSPTRRRGQRLARRDVEETPDTACTCAAVPPIRRAAERVALTGPRPSRSGAVQRLASAAGGAAPTGGTPRRSSSEAARLARAAPVAASAQRGGSGSPGGTARGTGVCPGSRPGRSRCVEPRQAGEQPRVYGWRGGRTPRRRAVSTTRPAYITAIRPRSGDHAEVVGDEDQRQPAVRAAASVEQRP